MRIRLEQIAQGFIGSCPMSVSVESLEVGETVIASRTVITKLSKIDGKDTAVQVESLWV